MAGKRTDEVFENIDGFISGPLDGFFSKYFGNAAADDAFRKTVREICEHHPLQDATASAEGFSRWVSAIVIQNHASARGLWGTACHSDQRHEIDPSAHVALTFTNTSPETGPDEAAMVIGAFCPGQAMSYKDGLLKLCAKASSIFVAQPTRLFLHGFYIRGDWAELFVFDRCGLYSCNPFNIQEDYQKFLTIILKYSSMTDAELGLSDLIKYDGMGPFIRLKKECSITLTSSTLRLAERPLAMPEDLVSKATTCFRARLPDSDRWDYVVKFKWRLKDDIPEDQVLRYAKERNVWGLLSLDYFDEIVDTANLRSGLRHRPYRRFPPNIGPDISDKVGTRGLELHTIETDKTFRVRTMVCIVTSPCGRPLHMHKSVLELLQVLRDAIKSHRSLYEDGGILHQDIAPGNIIINGSLEPEAPKGILIDLDVAMILGVGPRNPGGISITGTPPFMAVGALKGRPRTYRHDLESFLYVLLWAIISDGSESPPEGSKLHHWRGGDYEGLAARKMIDMRSGGFQSILSEFSLRYQNLQKMAEGFRQLLFPIREDDGTLWTGTVGSQEGRGMLYDGILQLFDQAISLHNT